MDKSLFFGSSGGDNRYFSADFAAWVSALFTDGVSPAGADYLQALATGGMGVSLQPGICCIQGHIGQNAGTKQLTLDVPDGVYSRIDLVVLRCDYVQRKVIETVKAGDADITPQPPALQRDADAWEICLARITVPGGASEITQADIADTRQDSTVCGLMNAILPVNYDAFFAQLDAAGKANIAAWSVEFETLLAQMHDLIDEETAGYLLNLINALDTRVRALETEVADLQDDIVQLSNPNLLINGDFKIAQRGTSFSASGYTMDRWLLELTSSGSVTQTDTGITLIASGGSAWMYQYVEGLIEALTGKEVTLSAKVNDVVYSFTTTLDPEIAIRESFPWGEMGVSLISSKGVRAELSASTGKTLAIEWAKLEMGDRSTAFIPRLSCEELAACQRYYLQLANILHVGLSNRSSNLMEFAIPVPTTFRVEPTYTGTPDVRAAGGTVQTGFSFTVLSSAPGCVVFRASKSSHGMTEAYMRLSAGSAFDAEIY